LRVLLLQLDGKLPNLALMRLAAHFRPYADDLAFQHCPTVNAVEASDWWGFDRIYASLIFERTRPVAEALLQKYRFAEVGGTGWDVAKRLEDIGIRTKQQDYSLYPHYPHSIGFTQRGCRLKCPFCVVPRKEGAVAEEQTVWDIWRKEPHPRNIVLLDNDFFGQPNWEKRIEEIRAGDFRVSFNQGINCRMITDEAAAAIASVRYYDDDFKRRRIYTAWDNLKDEERLFDGLEALTKHGVKPDHIMVYMLIGYWPGETAQERDYRRRRLREFGCRPYPMPFVRTKELVGFQRWVIGAYDKRFTWDHWQAADYRPEKLHLVESGGVEEPSGEGTATYPVCL
jgi:hypothetical protein